MRGDLLSLIEMGGDVASVLLGSGVTFDDVLAQKPLPCSTMADLFDRLAKGAPAGFGVTSGRMVRLQYLGTLGFRLSNCATIGELLADWARYSVIIGYPLASTMTIDGSCWTMAFHPRYPLSREALAFCTESTVAGFTQSLFNMSGHHIVLDEAAFPFPKPVDAALYHTIDARRISFGVPTAFVRGRVGDLDFSIVTADAEAREVGDAYCRGSLSELTIGEAFAGRVKALLTTMPIPLPDEQRVSGALRISIRTMQRNLAAEGLTFHGLVDDFRKGRAAEMLRQGHANKSIAHALGYGDVASFFRAFKRWTGQCPGKWRATSP